MKSDDVETSFIYLTNFCVENDSNNIQGGGVTPKIVSNLKGVIFNSNEAWHLGDDKIKPTETKRLPFLPQAINYI